MPAARTPPAPLPLRGMHSVSIPADDEAGATPFLASRQYPRQQELLGQDCPSHKRSVGVPADDEAGATPFVASRQYPPNKNCLDQNVQATSVASASTPTTTQVRRHSWRRVSTPANKNCLDKTVQATSAQARRQECRRTPVASAPRQQELLGQECPSHRDDGRNAVAPTLQAERGVSIPPKKRVRYHSRADRVAVFLAAGCL